MKHALYWVSTLAVMGLLASCAAPAATTATISTPTPAAQPTATPTERAAPTSTTAPTPQATPTAETPACLTAGGAVSEHSLDSDILALPIEYFIYLPPCYDVNADQRYPVLYMIHGQSYRHDQWINLGLTNQADAWIADGSIPPLIIVMPRDRVWTPPSEDLFGQGLVEELIPFIDSEYRTLDDRAYRAIGGLSRGAGWAMHLSFHHMDLFGAVGGHSLPVFWEDAPAFPRILQETPAEQLPRIYVDIGDRDRQEIMESTLWFVDLLASHDIPHEWYLFVGYHEEAYWAEHVPDYLLFYTAEW